MERAALVCGSLFLLNLEMMRGGRGGMCMSAAAGALSKLVLYDSK